MIMILFGAHIAEGITNLRVRHRLGVRMGASAIAGAPYHNKLAGSSTEWDGESEAGRPD